MSVSPYVWLVLAAVALLLLLGWLLVFVQQWRGRSRWRARMQERRKLAGAAGAAQDCRYDPKLFRGRR